MNGYGGQILRVNLATGKISREPTSPELARDFLGGRGFGAYFLYKEVPKGADPLGPENIDYFEWTTFGFDDSRRGQM